MTGVGEEVRFRDVEASGTVVSNRIGRELALQFDLDEALEASRYASHPYSTHPKEWPSLIETGNTWELPPVLISRYNSAGGEGTALCGIFSDIHRAWASVDNSLFLWRFDKWDGQCSEHTVGEQAICAVGLAKSVPGVFMEAIQYLLVVATPVELSLLGVCCSVGGDGLDSYAEVSIQPLPEYNVPSDEITMTCIACTTEGRIFLAGRDGHIYELVYTTGSGWQKRCRKVCLTAGLSTFLSRWILPNVFNFGATDFIIAMVVDNERKILYAQTEAMKLQVFIFGIDGGSLLKKVTEEKILINHKDIHASGQRVSNRSGKPSIVCMSPLSMWESKWMHLLVVLSDGRRMFLSTSSGSNEVGARLGGFSSSIQKPNCLKVTAIRPPPPLGVGSFGSIPLGSRAHGEDVLLKVESGFYSVGTLVLSDSSSPTTYSLIVANKDSSSLSSTSTGISTYARSSQALRETVSSYPIDGRMLFAADVLPSPDTAATIKSLYSGFEFFGIEHSEESCEKLAMKLWARGDILTQHILPRRRIVIFSTMGMTEIIFNRPIDILRSMFESNAPRTILEDFFNRFGASEAGALCLMLAARIVQSETFISNIIAEKAAEAFEDPRLVGLPQLECSNTLPSRTASGSFNMGQVVQEAEPVFSGSHEGLCLCVSRLLFPIWEFPVMVSQGGLGASYAIPENGVLVCRFSIASMQMIENKIRSLEKFLRSRRNQKKGLYGCVAGLGDFTGSILYDSGSDSNAGGMNMMRNIFGTYTRNMEGNDVSATNKRQRLPYSAGELAAMEVRATECIRQLLLRSGEAIFLLKLLSQHNMIRLIQDFDIAARQALAQLTFHQLVCTEEGDRLATVLISSLMRYYTGPDFRGTVDDVSRKLREGCPSFFKESDYKFFVAVDCLEKAVVASDSAEKEQLAREAFQMLTQIPESADLRTVCKRFEDLRFYEAVVWLPLRKAQSLDPNGDAFNDQIDAVTRNHALRQREHCYEIVASALQSLKGESQQREFGSPITPAAKISMPEQASQTKYIGQIIQLVVQSSDRLSHEYLYKTLIHLGLENELLEYGGPDLVPFLQRAGCESKDLETPVGQSSSRLTSNQIKYLNILARYYVSRQQHILAAHILLRLAERRSHDSEDVLSLEQRRQYLSNAVVQAKNACERSGFIGPSRGNVDNGMLDLLEGKLAVLRFQMKIKDQLEGMALKLETSGTNPGEGSMEDTVPNAEIGTVAREKAKELSVDLKTITQLYNEYSVPFELWEICLEILYFANCSGDTDSSIVRETWARLIDQALSNGGIAEACSVLKRVGSYVYPGDGAVLPLDTLCLHLEKAALQRVEERLESVGDEDVPRAVLAACKGATEVVLNTYDQLLSNGAILPSPNLRLRLLRSVLVVLREWAMSLFAHRMGTSSVGASLILGGTFSTDRLTVINQGISDKITTAANRYMTEVKRLPLPQSRTEAVYRGFQELEESLISPFDHF